VLNVVVATGSALNVETATVPVPPLAAAVIAGVVDELLTVSDAVAGVVGDVLVADPEETSVAPLVALVTKRGPLMSVIA
jgi:hypothetical protein